MTGRSPTSSPDASRARSSASLRVGLDVTAQLIGSTGSARYVRELGDALERQRCEIVRFAIGRGHDPGALPVRRFRVPVRVVHRAWSILRAPRGEWLAPGCDLIHVPDLVPPPTRKPLVMTVFDVDAIELPDLHPERATRIQRTQVAAARDDADVVLTISQATAGALQRHGIDRDRIVVTPLGVTALPAPDASATPDGPFLLAVGGLAARKGQRELVRSFSRSDLNDVRLVLAGPDGFRAEDVRAEIAACGAEERVVCTGGVTDAQLAALYERSIAVCVPSLGEGFGLPVLEAAAAGAVVVASDLPVLRELDAAVALYAAPGDDEAWAVALQRITADVTLRERSRARAREFARQFTWDTTAATTLAAYGRALSTS